MKQSVQSYMRDVPQQVSLYLGFLLIIMGLAFNMWLIEPSIVPDGQIESSATVAMVAMIQAATVILGVYLAIRRPLLDSQLGVRSVSYLQEHS